MCMSSIHVQNWRVKTKERIIAAFGGKCGICGYNKCHRALNLHHLNPSEKEFTLGSIRGWPKAWDSVVKELRKCVMVCSNCHGEIHDGVTQIPIDIPRFNEEFSDYKNMERMEKLKSIEQICPVCKEKFYNDRGKFCSPKCYNVHNRKCVHPSKEELKKMITSQSMLSIGKNYGVSDNAVRKWCKKYNLLTCSSEAERTTVGISKESNVS